MEYDLNNLEDLPRIFQDLSLDMSIKAGKAEGKYVEWYEFSSKKYRQASKMAKELDDFIKKEKSLLATFIQVAEEYGDKKCDTK